MSEVLLSIDATNPLYFYGHKKKTDDPGVGKECLSNWYPASFIDEKDNFEYGNSEQYMMAGKAQLFNDMEMLQNILADSRPKICKQFGRKVNKFDHKTWDSNCKSIVENGCYLKFSQNPELKKFLLSTENRLLVEASPFDKTWGIGHTEKVAKTMDMNEWKGKNYLGECLMRVRDRLRK